MRMVLFWQKQIRECEHCLACRKQIVDIYNVMPQEPIIMTQERYAALWLKDNLPR